MGLVGIYSFPKSGNTWIRAIVAHLIAAEAGPLPEEHARKLFLRIPDLHKENMENALTLRGHRFFKSHAGTNLAAWRGEELNTTHVIHIRRNPLDVFVSYLNFVSKNVTGEAPISFDSIDELRKTPLFRIYFDAFILFGHISPKFSLTTGTYFEHNNYWMKQTGPRIAHLRYEDLLRDTEGSLAFLADWFSLPEGWLPAAIEAATFSTRKNDKFFWRQQEKNYFNYLLPNEIDLFLRYHGEECKALGYDPDYLRTPPEPLEAP